MHETATIMEVWGGLGVRTYAHKRRGGFLLNS